VWFIFYILWKKGVFSISSRVRLGGREESFMESENAAPVGVTVNGTPGLKLRTQYSTATLIQTATDNWLLAGDISA
jgi:hypothetical protein